MKETRWTIFHKILLFIVLLLIPIVLLYSYSNLVSVKVVQDTLRESLVSRLSFLQNRLNTQVNHMSRSGFLLSADPSLSSVDSLDSFKEYFDVIQFKKQLEARIAVQSNTMEWPMAISVYFPLSAQVISPASVVPYDKQYLESRVNSQWKAWKVPGTDSGRFDFYFYASTPYSAYYNPASADNIVEIRFSDSSLISMLDDYKQSAQGDPFLFLQGTGVIANSSADRSVVAQVTEALNSRPKHEQDSFNLQLNGESYLVNSILSPALGWTLVDFVPMQHVLMPMKESTRLFYVSIGMLLVVGIITAFLLYRHVQLPLRILVRSLKSVKRGDFSTRILNRSHNEFRFVFQQFNEMTGQIGELVDHVYRQKLATRDAQLKQLQSQINPHFLYNCLYYIVNMVRLGKEDAVEKMAMNLGDYYKYTTRSEKQEAALAEEIQLVVNYLEIQNLRMKRIQYSIDLPQEVLSLEVPRLLLQPVVENAVIHGIEPQIDGGHIRISGKREGNRVEIVVEDNGIGVSPEKLDELTQQLNMPMRQDMGYGIWNVNQRLMLSFGDRSGVRYEHSAEGGLTVTLIWYL
ncbi:sensor histidine kinase [Cohnella silvisoli]|uniref:Sensor histidine kinase n=1 Tax=Cohnella silvisoli TaxID=2873699 RepID=A0ABV1KKW9_9BACL|nr:sensor histidine kinase [Cohnella silvisoli]MCD9020856.1 sensor histidine kinase [Cohnella silvisoli]